MQDPQIHDRVLYHPAPDDKCATIAGQPLAAIVCGIHPQDPVHSSRHVNLVIFDAKGLAWNRESVLICEDVVAGGRWCRPLLGSRSAFCADGALSC